MRIVATVLLCAVSLCGAETYCLEAGHVCHLADASFPIGPPGWTPTATSPKAYDEFRECLRTNDKQGLVQLVKIGSVLFTKRGDGIRILDYSLWNERIEGRIATGKYAGQKVWVTMKWVTR